MADIIVQPKVFIIFVLSGMLSAVAYALLRGLRGSKKRRMWTGLLDLLFVIAATALFGACSVYALNGEIRLFSLLAFVAGFAVFLAGPGAALTRTIRNVARYTWRLVRKTSEALDNMLAKYKADE